MYTHFRNHIFFYILALSVFVVSIISFHRFIFEHDYMVGYEGVCDPNTDKCFVGCEDDECTKEYYYSEMVKYAPDLYKECGSDITDCEAASVCLPSDYKCSVIYCDTEADGDVCEMFTGETNNQIDSTEEGNLLQSNNTNNI